MNREASILVSLVVVPMMTAPIVAMLRPRGLAWLTATIASAVVFVAATQVTAGVLLAGELRCAMGGWAPPEGIELRVGPFAALVLLLVSGASTLALLGGRESLALQVVDHRQPLFYTAWLLGLAGLCGIAVSGDAFNIFVFMEISSLASYVLIGAGPDRRALPAVFKYLVMGTIGATFYLIGVGLLYMMTGTLNIADLEARLGNVTDLRPVLVAAGFVTVGLALKAAVFPLHAWLPNAYARAPHMVTVFLGACATKVAILVLLQFDFLVFQGNLVEHDLKFAGFLVPLALLGMLVGSAVAMFERDLKKLFAWSSIAQVGYILLGAGLVSVAGATASVFHTFAHGIAKATVFLAVAALAMRSASLRIEELAGAWRSMPWTLSGLLVGALSLIGMPGTAGFVSKWLLIGAALESGPLGVVYVAVIVLSSLMAVAYVWRIVEVTAFGVPAVPVVVRREAPLVMLCVLWAAALANLWFGVATDLPLDLASRAAEGLVGSIDGR